MSHAAPTTTARDSGLTTPLGVGSVRLLAGESVTLEKISSPQDNTCIDLAEHTNRVAVLLPAQSNLDAKVSKPAARNKIEVNGETAIIIVKYKTDVKRCIVDKEDLPRVAGFKWNYHYRGAIHNAEHKKGYLMLAKLIARVPEGSRYYFKNGDCWDCRKTNIIRGKSPLEGRFYSTDKIYYDNTEKKWRVNANIVAKGCKTIYNRPYFNSRAEAEKHLEGISAKMFVQQFIARSGQRGLVKYQDDLEGLFRAAVLWTEKRHQAKTVSNLKPVNLYEGNADYENCVAEVPLDEETGMWDGFNIQRRD